METASLLLPDLAVARAPPPFPAASLRSWALERRYLYPRLNWLSAVNGELDVGMNIEDSEFRCLANPMAAGAVRERDPHPWFLKNRRGENHFDGLLCFGGQGGSQSMKVVDIKVGVGGETPVG